MISPSSIAPSKLDWELRKDIIKELYITQNRSLKYVCETLGKGYQGERAFKASESKYKRKLKAWGSEKNHKSTEWQAIDRSLSRRSLDQSTARVIIKDSNLGPGKIKRGLRRHVLPSLKRKREESDSPHTPEHIHIVESFPRELVNPVIDDLPGLQLIERARGLPSHSERPRSRANTFTPGLLQPNPNSEGRRIHQGATAFSQENKVSESIHGRELAVSSQHHRTSLQDTLISGSSGGAADSSGIASLSSDMISTLRSSIGTKLSVYFPKQEPDDIPDDLMSRPALDQILISYGIYLCSNNLIYGEELEKFVEFVLLKHQHQLLHYFSHPSSTPPQCFQEGLLLRAARHGRVDLLDLLASHHVNLRRPIRSSPYGYEVTTALREAIVNKLAAFCERLIELEVDVAVSAPAATKWSNSSHGNQTTMALAAQNLPDVAGFISREHLGAFDRERILFEAIEAGADGDEVCRLVSQGANVNCVDESLWTPLHYAISRHDGPLTKCLLDNGATPDGATAESMEPTLRTLCIDDEWVPADFMTPLALAVDLNNLEICEQLLAAKADVNLSIYDRLPQFFLDDHGDCIKDLIDTASMEDLEDHGRPAVDRTISLADCLCDKDEYSGGFTCFSTALEYAIRRASTAVVKLLLKGGADLSMSYTTSPLALALLRRQVDCVELLINHGANPAEVRAQRLGIDALQAASMTDVRCIAPRLIQAGADIKAPINGVQVPTVLQGLAVQGDTDFLK